MRQMQSEDLGDLKLYEDEAIREQAARLQVHLSNLYKRLEANGTASAATANRLRIMESEASQIAGLADDFYFKAQ